MVKEKIKYDSVLVGYIIGIVSIVSFLVSPLVAVILGIIGLFHIKGETGPIYKRAKILNILGIIFGILFFLLVVGYSLTKLVPQLASSFPN